MAIDSGYWGNGTALDSGYWESGEDTNAPTNADHIRSMTDEELAEFMCKLAYARETPWSEPFAEKFCKSCPTVHCVLEDGREMDLTECDFADGECPHGVDTVWWLKTAYKEDA